MTELETELKEKELNERKLWNKCNDLGRQVEELQTKLLSSEKEKKLFLLEVEEEEEEEKLVISVQLHFT